MERAVKRIILRATTPCEPLYKHLNSTQDSIGWLGKQGARSLLNLAIMLDETFGPEILTLVLKQ